MLYSPDECGIAREERSVPEQGRVSIGASVGATMECDEGEDAEKRTGQCGLPV